jgi:predicted kinase
MIWDEYLPGIMVSGKSKFEDFSEANVQAFYRLKLQSIEKQIQEKHASGSESKQVP